MAERPNSFYKLPRVETPINKTSELKQLFVSVNKVLSNDCILALKQMFSGKQFVLMTNASFRSAGYARRIGDNTDPIIQSKRKTYGTWLIHRDISRLPNSKKSVHSEEFETKYAEFLEFPQTLWEKTESTTVLTERKLVTRFFWAKAIPPALWNECDYISQNTFKKALIAGSSHKK